MSTTNELLGAEQLHVYNSADRVNAESPHGDDQAQDDDNSKDKSKGLSILFAFLFNMLIWFVLLCMSTPWNVIFVTICIASKKKPDDIGLHSLSHSHSSQTSINMEEESGEAAAAPAAKKTAHDCRSLLINQYEIWMGAGVIVNSIILWAILSIYAREMLLNVPTAWQVAIFCFICVMGVLLIIEGVLEEFVGNEGRLKFEMLIVDNIKEQKCTRTPCNIQKKEIKTRGILFHYAMLAAIIALTAGYTTTQIVDIIENSTQITIEHCYEWFSALFTAVVAGSKIVLCITHFMFYHHPQWGKVVGLS